ncbi:RNA polymerase sigma factor [Alkaliflexus imshenetskii]|uniref:RNA polymerase sigma factor n=1 Tax=Alkaliflexus imshenetskii TaxID=286730 RepID=UPI0004B1525D|nr:sigma-70 family RNA polymerase sigma factor [Alkaliflexus imshenetskii]
MKHPSSDDLEIVARIRAGDKESFSALVEKYSQRVFQSCMGFLHDTDEAADLTQEVFVKVFEKLGDFRGEASFSTWLYRITLNMALNHSRKLKLKRFFYRFSEDGQRPELQLTNDSSADSGIIREEQRQLIRKCVDKLPAMQRKAFILNHYQDMSNSEMASVLRLSLKATESLLFRARSRMKTELKKSLNPEIWSVSNTNKQ